MNQSIRRIIMPTMIVALTLSSTIVANAGLNSAREDQIIISGHDMEMEDEKLQSIPIIKPSFPFFLLIRKIH